jgi:hypothetical protein
MLSRMKIPPRSLRARFLVFYAVPLLVLFGVAASAVHPQSKPGALSTGPLRIAVSIDPAARKEPVSGRLLLLLSRTEKFDPDVNGTPIFGLNVNDVKPGGAVSIDDAAFGYPIRRLSDIPAGEYFAQVWLNVYTTFKRADGKVVQLHMDQGEGQNWQTSPGNLFSDPVKVRLGPGAPGSAALVLNHVIPPLPSYKDTARLKHIKIQSRLLTAFWGRSMSIGANILLPKGYDEHPGVRYPVVYQEGHFPGGRVAGFDENPQSPGFKRWNAGDLPRFIQVTIEDACPYYDDSYGVNSENVGPYGDAVVTELIPFLEKNFRMIARPWGRLLTGGSTGGWIALAVQVFYPDVFGGTWALFPDPVDFRKYQIVNLYDDANAYFMEHEWTRVPRGAARDTSGNLIQTMEQQNLFEEAVGDRYRSGGQWAIWNALFAPVAEDGYPMPFWDPVSGAINKTAAAWAGERYDLRRVLEKNWPPSGSKLAGKIHVYCGRMDNFYLNEACYLLQSALEKAANPPYGGEFRYGDRGGHGWSPFKDDELARLMAEHVFKAAPEAGKEWIY